MTNHETFMAVAIKEAETALLNNEFPVGCVITYNDKIIATGARTGSSGNRPNELDHAEINALRTIATLKEPVPDKNALSVYCTLEPCLMCTGAILISGIKNIIYAYEDAMGGGTGVDFTTLSPLYRDSEVVITPHVMRKESLALFKKFFQNPDNTYWKDSLLSQYTLNQ